MEPPVKKIRDKKVMVYLTVEEDEQLQWAADELGIPRSSYIRMVALKDAKEVLA